MIFSLDVFSCSAVSLSLCLTIRLRLCHILCCFAFSSHQIAARLPAHGVGLFGGRGDREWLFDVHGRYAGAGMCSRYLKNLFDCLFDGSEAVYFCSISTMPDTSFIRFSLSLFLSRIASVYLSLPRHSLFTSSLLRIIIYSISATFVSSQVGFSQSFASWMGFTFIFAALGGSAVAGYLVDRYKWFQWTMMGGFAYVTSPKKLCHCCFLRFVLFTFQFILVLYKWF